VTGMDRKMGKLMIYDENLHREARSIRDMVRRRARVARDPQG